MKKKILSVIVIIALVATFSVVAYNIGKKSQQVISEQTSSIQIDEVDREKQEIALGLTDLVYETSDSEESISTVWELICEEYAEELPQYLNWTIYEKGSVWAPYTAVSTGGRYLVQIKNSSVWVQPSQIEFVELDGKLVKSSEIALLSEECVDDSEESSTLHSEN